MNWSRQIPGILGMLQETAVMRCAEDARRVSNRGGGAVKEREGGGPVRFEDAETVCEQDDV